MDTINDLYIRPFEAMIQNLGNIGKNVSWYNELYPVLQHERNAYYFHRISDNKRFNEEIDELKRVFTMFEEYMKKYFPLLHVQ
jgi:coproporphyrinogen III oxidase